ncbi:uncharacterized protein A4U43_C07F20480 [Asparagus officinalis]|uniref:Ubiquitin-like domain-containing protein n=1 Tax=Asparagus officinalis TaxID=4686 RepID=A0A5P1EIN3_ASPOF|nr:uncharacterized protein A4U43_C07F20480 [Asparagus officinalis]
MIEVVLNDRLGKKVRVKCNEDDTIGDLKKLVAAQTGTLSRTMRSMMAWDSSSTTIDGNGGLVDESSPGRETPTLVIKENAVGPSSMPKSSCRPSKELIGMDDSVEARAGTLSNQMKNDASERI